MKIKKPRRGETAFAYQDRIDVGRYILTDTQVEVPGMEGAFRVMYSKWIIGRVLVLVVEPEDGREPWEPKWKAGAHEKGYAVSLADIDLSLPEGAMSVRADVGVMLLPQKAKASAGK